MLTTLPGEIIEIILRFCSLRDLSRLSQCCRNLGWVCRHQLFCRDAASGSYSVFYAIASCGDEGLGLNILRGASCGGSELDICLDGPPSRPSRMAYSPIHLATRRGLNYLVQFILDRGISPDGPRDLTLPPLLEAIWFRNESTALLLARAGASLSFQRPNTDALEAAIRVGLHTVTCYLVREAGCDVNATGSYDYPPLLTAVHYRHAGIFELLVRLGADIQHVTFHLSRLDDFDSLYWILNTAQPGILSVQHCKHLLVYITEHTQPNPRNIRSMDLVTGKLSAMVTCS